MLGLGYTVGTSKEGIQAEAIVVHNFDELKNLGDKVMICLYYIYNNNTKYIYSMQSSGATKVLLMMA